MIGFGNHYFGDPLLGDIPIWRENQYMLTIEQSNIDIIVKITKLKIH